MLESLIIQEIQEDGPITQARFMELALGHPLYGYYRTREAVSQDFTTAPEISQIFGELIGVWVSDLLQKLNQPQHVTLVELGPGKGTLMADLLRVTSKISDKFNIYLVEINPLLKESQQSKIPNAIWVERLDDVPITSDPLIIIANEFFDTFPTQCFVRENNILYERCIAVEGEKVTFIQVPLREEYGPDKIEEKSLAAEVLFGQICTRLLKQKGAFLCIDYGYESGEGDTLQALYKGNFSSPLIHVGHSDLTCHVDFGRLRDLALAKKLGTLGPLSQSEFLKNMGLDVRLDMLKHKNPNQGNTLEIAATRLIHPFQMGLLFKAMTVFSPPSLKPIGFKP